MSDSLFEQRRDRRRSDELARWLAKPWLLRVLDALFRIAPNQRLVSKERGALSLSELNNLARFYCTSYASPHHVTFTVEGLRNLIDAACTDDGKRKAR